MKEPKAISSTSRMRKKEFSTTLITENLMRAFKKKYPEYKHLDNKELNKKWDDISSTIREELVTNPLGVKLGAYTGELKLQYTPNKIDAYNHQLSKELGEKVKYLNIAQKGKVAIIKWERRWAVKFNKILQFYAFDASRKINDLAKKHIDEYPEKLRIARSTLGGFSIWRYLKNK